MSTILQYDEKIPCQCPSKEGEKQHTHNGQSVSQQGQNLRVFLYNIFLFTCFLIVFLNSKFINPMIYSLDGFFFKHIGLNSIF